MKASSWYACICFCIISSEAFTFRGASRNNYNRCKEGPKLFLINEHARDNDEKTYQINKSPNRSIFVRRNFLSSAAALLGGTALAQPSNAGEVGAIITKAVTTSDLGISVRRSVVKGAQVMDKLDGKWEKFSDENGLGSERFKQQERPKPRQVPDLKPLNVDMAKQILRYSDEAFMVSSGVSSDVLSSQIRQVDGLVRKSFERSGLEFHDTGTLSGSEKLIGIGETATSTMTAKEFNYYCYVHFKAFCDILVNDKLAYNKKVFEGTLGEKILPLFVPSAENIFNTLASKQEGLSPKSKEALLNGISSGLSITDEIMSSLVANGLVAQAERNEIDNEKIIDWTDDLADIQLSIPLDDDATLASQLLLQEQGYRIYPDFGRFVITSALKKSLALTNQNVSSDEYYMDTNYSSDPDLFEVRQVLLNIVIDS